MPGPDWAVIRLHAIISDYKKRTLISREVKENAIEILVGRELKESAREMLVSREVKESALIRLPVLSAIATKLSG